MDRDNKNKLLEITKQYASDEFADNINCLGYGIDVFQSSINKTFREYLVNYDYLTILLENYGFVPLTAPEAKAFNLTSSIGGFEQLFKLMQTNIKSGQVDKETVGNAYKMTREEKEISFLNNYFIFKKVRNVDIQDIKVGLIQKTPEEQEEEHRKSLVVQEEVKEVLSQEEGKKSKPQSKKKVTLVQK